MLLQTNSYIVPRDKRAEHARLLRRFRQVLIRLGCDHFEVYEQVGANWSTGETTGRFVQILRFRDRKHQMDVQHGERNDPAAQQVVAEFCELINFPYQQQQGLFAVGFYTSFLKMPPQRTARATQSADAGAAELPPSIDAPAGDYDMNAPSPDEGRYMPEPGVVHRRGGGASADEIRPVDLDEDDGPPASPAGAAPFDPADDMIEAERVDVDPEDEDDAPLTPEELAKAHAALDEDEEDPLRDEDPLPEGEPPHGAARRGNPSH